MQGTITREPRTVARALRWSFVNLFQLPSLNSPLSFHDKLSPDMNELQLVSCNFQSHRRTPRAIEFSRSSLDLFLLSKTRRMYGIGCENVRYEDAIFPAKRRSSTIIFDYKITARARANRTRVGETRGSFELFLAVTENVRNSGGGGEIKERG